MFLLDTCVVSEGVKAPPSDAVDAWWRAQDEGALYISAVTVGELSYGIERLPEGRRRAGLRQWLDRTLAEGFSGRIFSFDASIAFAWARLRAQYPNSSTVDSQIAATAIVHGLTIVTRNVRDFDFEGLAVFNPWRT